MRKVAPWAALGAITAAVAVTLALLVTAVFSCYIPARQVLRVDPTVALRAE